MACFYCLTWKMKENVCGLLRGQKLSCPPSKIIGGEGGGAGLPCPPPPPPPAPVPRPMPLTNFIILLLFANIWLIGHR